MKSLKFSAFGVISITIFLTSCGHEPPLVSDDDILNIQLELTLREMGNDDWRDYYTFPSSSDYSDIPQDPNNPIYHEKVTLGRLLYHETGLGLNSQHAEGIGTYSCASCHFAAAGFQAGRKQGIGDGGIGIGAHGEARQPNPIYAFSELDVQPIRTPTVLNGAYQSLMLWNGQFGATGLNATTQAQWTPNTPKAVNHLGYEGLEIQAIAGLTVHRLKIDSTFIHSTDYKRLFDEAFPFISPTERYTRENAGLAIAAYERIVLANQAPFQQWLKGNLQAMTKLQKEGAILFFKKAKCGSCHNGPALNSMEFHALGMADLDGDGVYGITPNNEANLGRGGFTQQPQDNYKFKVPQLYNLKDSPFYGHGSSFTTIREVVEYKNNGIPENSNVPLHQLADTFQPLNLTISEIDAIVEFIENALYDPNLMRYQPDHVYSGNCIPNNDMESRQDLGCN